MPEQLAKDEGGGPEHGHAAITLRVRQTDRQVDKQTDRQADRQTSRQADRHTGTQAV